MHTSLSPLQETDKATIDVEAQDDGVMGKILVRQTHIVAHTLHMTLIPRG